MIVQDLHNAASFSESKTTTIIVVCVVFAAISLGMLLLRLYIRCRVLKASGLDDWTMLIAQILAIVVSVTTVLETKYGLGRHVWGVPSKNEYLYINIILYNLTMNVIKISFLLQYYRIFHSDGIRNVCFCMMIYVVVWAIAQGTLLGLTCVPLAIILPSTAGWCLHTLPIWYFSSAMNIVTDAAIFVIPLPSVVRLQLPRRQKVVIMFVFCLGFGVCAISVARIFTLRAAANTQDPTWDNTDAAVWSVIEMNCAILCSSVPTLRPLFARKLSGLKSTLSRTTTKRGRSRSIPTTARTVWDEEAVRPTEPMPELHLKDLEELARRSSRSQPQARPQSKPRPDTGVFVTVQRGSADGFEKLLVQMDGDGGQRKNQAQTQKRKRAQKQIVVTTEMSVTGPHDDGSP